MEAKSKYKIRHAARLLGHAPKPREVMPWFYDFFMKDFAEREREQAEAQRRGPLSTDPQRPWGGPRSRRDVEAEEEAISEPVLAKFKPL